MPNSPSNRARASFVLAFCMMLVLHPNSLAQPSPARPGENVIYPGAEWLDDRGQAIEAHGGGIIQVKGTFYWFGEDHAKTDDRLRRYVNCYASEDLVHWKFRNQVVTLVDPEHLGEGWVLERPKVFLNRSSKQYVMYAHIDDARYKLARVAVFVSDKVDGEYRYLKSFRPLGQESRDIGQFIDDDGSAYLIFESRPTHGFFIAKLSDTYLDVAKQVAFIREPLEGGALLHLHDRYFVVGSHLTGYDANPNVYATASRLEGPWSEMKNIAPPETNTYDSQSTTILKIAGSEATAAIYIGDRWKVQALWDSRYIWMPLNVNGESLSLPMPRAWTIDLHTGRTSIR